MIIVAVFGVAVVQLVCAMLAFVWSREKRIEEASERLKPWQDPAYAAWGVVAFVGVVGYWAAGCVSLAMLSLLFNIKIFVSQVRQRLIDGPD